MTVWTLSKNYSYTPIRCMCKFVQKQGFPPLFPTSQTIIKDGLLMMWLYGSQRGWSLERLRNFIPMSIWKSRINFVKFLLVFDRCLTFKIFYLIDIFVRFNHVSMVLNSPINGLVWRFPEIASQAIISFENLLHQYT